MSKEAMKLALEALRTLHDENMDYLTRNKLGGENNQCMVFAREAITALREALAQQALDRMAENARELGLDYESAPVQQEPVAYIHRQGNHYEVSERFLSDDEKARGWTEEPLYTSPPAQRKSRSDVKPLTDEEIDRLWVPHTIIQATDRRQQAFARAIEAKLKEKNT